MRFLMRPMVVLLRQFAPGLLVRLAGPSPRVVTLIRTHHDSAGPAAALHAVDDEH